MGSQTLARVADSKVTEIAEMALQALARSSGVMMGIDRDIPEFECRNFPMENVWAITQGGCLSLPECQPSCPFNYCRFHVQNGLQAKVIAKQISGTDTCVLRVAAGNPHTLDETAQMFGVTRERIRQIELKALFRMGMNLSYVGVISRSQVKLRRIVQYDKGTRKNKIVYDGGGTN